nr:MAG TPA: hypothetical protein [Caudoviricetes sp.]
MLIVSLLRYAGTGLYDCVLDVIFIRSVIRLLLMNVDSFIIEILYCYI